MRALLLLLVATPALASDPPRCTPAQLGAVACLSGRLCECRYERGGSITGLPGGVRWNCSILRPSCGVPEPLFTPMPLPPGLLLQLPPPDMPPAWMR